MPPKPYFDRRAEDSRRLVPTTVSADTEDRLATISQEILSNTRLKKIIDDYELHPRERSACRSMK